MMVWQAIKNQAKDMARVFVKKTFLKTVTGHISNPTPKSELFPYSYYDKKTELFYTESGTLGFIFEGEPVAGMDESFYKQLSLIFDDGLPLNACLQTLLLASDDLSRQLSMWKKARVKKTDIVRRLEASKDAFYKDFNEDRARSFKHRNYRFFFYGLKKRRS